MKPTTWLALGKAAAQRTLSCSAGRVETPASSAELTTHGPPWRPFWKHSPSGKLARAQVGSKVQEGSSGSPVSGARRASAGLSISDHSHVCSLTWGRPSGSHDGVPDPHGSAALPYPWTQLTKKVLCSQNKKKASPVLSDYSEPES